MTSEYTKPYQSPSQLVSYLISKNLTVTSSESAISFLENVNYHRFKIYLLPFLDSSTGCYISGTSFSHGKSLYNFDNDLRELIFECVEQFEIRLRTKLDQVLTPHFNTPFWYLESSNFKGFDKMIAPILYKLMRNFSESKNEYAVHFTSNYHNTFSEFRTLPPFWAIAEFMSFGHLLKIYTHLKLDPLRYNGRDSYLSDIAHSFGAKNIVTFTTWLDTIRDIRNRSAHHNRLWNSNIRNPKEVTRFLKQQPARPNRMYSTLVMINTIITSAKINIDLKASLVDLLAEYPIVSSNLSSMGFPENWCSDPFWD